MSQKGYLELVARESLSLKNVLKGYFLMVRVGMKI